ncbi:MAG: hypothetical protein WAQ98_19180 [Blastocatellia bacterium]
MGITAIEKEIEQYILSNLKERFNLPAEKISISETHPLNFPADARIFRAEKRGSYGNIYYNYILVNGKFYCSIDENNFSQLLATEKFTSRPRWNPHQFATLFLHLVVRELRLVESPSDISKSSDEAFNSRIAKITAPSLEIVDNAIEAHFWSYQARYKRLDYWQIHIDSDYQMTYERLPEPK